MEIAEYKNIYDRDQTHWWYKSLNFFLKFEIKKYNSKFNLLDIGSGPGGQSFYLKKIFYKLIMKAFRRRQTPIYEPHYRYNNAYIAELAAA